MHISQLVFTVKCGWLDAENTARKVQSRLNISEILVWIIKQGITVYFMLNAFSVSRILMTIYAI